MEGIGFLTAIHANNAKGIVIRGISDLLGNKEESDKSGWQEKAAHHAAAFAFAMLKKLAPNNGSVPPEPPHRFPPLPDKYPFFIGRTEKCNEVIAAIARFRLVTIKSIGGIGKTALARAVLNSPVIRQKFDNRIAWVGLDVVACDSKDAVIAVIAEQLNLNERSYSVENEQLSSPIDRVVKALIGNEVLLVLDSCEPVVNSVRELCIELQALAFELYVLATSTKVLGVDEENLIELEPMCLPVSAVPFESFIDSEAVKLFKSYAQLKKSAFGVTKQNFRLIAEILDYSEGMPLAIRLIAVRVRNKTLEDIKRELGVNPIQSPSNQASINRHASLEQCFDWSFGLLSNNAKKLFPFLSLFIAPFTGKQAISLAQGTQSNFINPGILSEQDSQYALAELVDASFLDLDDNNERYLMLGLLSSYGRARLEEEGKLRKAKTLFADSFAEFSGEIRALRLPLNKPYDRENLYQAGKYALEEKLNGATSKLRRNIDNWLSNTFRNKERLDFNQRLIALQDESHTQGIVCSWTHIGLAESLNALGQPIDDIISEYLLALEHIPQQWPHNETEAYNRQRIEAQTATKLSQLYARQGNMPKAFECINNMLGDEQHLTAEKFRASLYDQLGRLYLDTHYLELAAEQFEQALRLRENVDAITERDKNQRHNEQAHSYLNLGDVYFKSHKLDDANAAYKKAVILWEEAHRWHDVNIALSKLAKVLSFAGKVADAETMFQSAIAQRMSNHDERGASLTEAEFAVHYKRKGEIGMAKLHINNAIENLRNAENSKELSRILDVAANISVHEKDWGTAKKYLLECLELQEKLGERDQVITLSHLGKLYDALGEIDNARKYIDKSIALARLIARPLDLARALFDGAVMKARHGPFDEVETLLNEAIPIFNTMKRTQLATNAQDLLKWNMELRIKSGTDWTNDEYRASSRAIRSLGERMRATECWDIVANEYQQMINDFARTPIQAAIAQNELGSALHHMTGCIDKAIECHEQSLNFFQNINNQSGIADSLHKLGEVWFERAKIDQSGRGYNQAGQEAIEYYQKSISCKRNLCDPVGLVLSYEGLAEVKEMLGDIESSFLALMDARKEIPLWSTSANAKHNAERLAGFLMRHPDFRERVGAR